jgi:putative nucleotidyltransferase with HDIG domain
MNYISIRVSTLRGDQKINFNTYVKLNEKHLLYIRRGDSFEGERLQRFKEKKVKKLFILMEDEQSYLSYLQKNIEMAYDNKSGKDIGTRAEIIQGSQQSNAEEVFENPENAISYNYAKDAAGKYVSFIMSNAEGINAVMNIENTDKNIAHHGVIVSTLAIALAQKLGLTDEKRVQLLTLGSLLHDFGHHTSNLNLIQPLDKMTPADLDLWKKHPKAGADRVSDKKHFDQAVINIISQHEETSNGLGPLGMHEKEIDPLALIVSSANAMDRIMTYEGVPKADAAKTLMLNHVGRHPLQHLQILGEIIKGL